MRPFHPSTTPRPHLLVPSARRILASVLTGLLSAVLLVGLTAASPAPPGEDTGRSRTPLHEPIVLTGVASWYGEAFRGRATACGDRYDPDAVTAAHRTLPCGARVRVEHGDRAVVVTITDRGPFVDGRELDLSRGAFERLAHPDEGLIEVRATVLTP